jgi:hypothetical protein
VAVGAHTGGGAIAVFKSHCASVVYHRLEAEPDVLPVRIVTLDDFVRSLSLTRIDLLKVDIEGAEIEVLQNASREVLSMCDQICVEFHDFLDPASITDIRCAIRRLRLLGFGAFRCSVLNRSDILFVHRRLIESRVAKILLWMAIVRALMTGEKARSFAHHVRIWMAGGLAARAR